MNTIKINNIDIEKPKPSLVKGSDLYKLANIPEEKKLFLNIKEGVDIFINKDDCIILVNNEVFITKPDDIIKTSALKNQISIYLNGEPIKLDCSKIKGGDICKKDIALESPQLYADLKNLPDQYIKNECTLIVRDGDCFITVPISLDHIIDIEECTKNNRKPPKGQSKYKIRIDGKKYTVEASHLLGKEILALVNKKSEDFDLQQKFKGGKRKPITPNQDVDFSTKDVERFETIPKHVQQG